MKILYAIILGAVQGLTEFLPVSSSGHLLLFQKIMGFPAETNLFMTVMLHVGTLVSVIIVYRKRVSEMLIHPKRQAKYWLFIILATLVTAVMGSIVKLALKDENGALETRLLGFCFLITAVLLLICDSARKKYKLLLTVPTMKWYHAAFIGFMQGIGTLAGVSRSGATITGAVCCKMKKEDSAEFSFLLSIPAVVGSAFLEIFDTVKTGAVGSIDWLPTIIGMLTAGAVGYFAVRFMIRLITKRSFLGFAIYTALLGVFVILDRFAFHLIKW